MTFKMLDTCTGIGGFTLAYESTGHFRTVAFCEIDQYADLILRYYWPHIYNLGDLRVFTRGRRRPVARRFFEAYGPIDVLTGGIPCQPTSSLGRMRGTADERWLWPDALRLVRLLRPKVVHFENPPALLTLERGRAFGGIATELAALGYDLWWDVVPAAAFGAGHLRERLFLIGTDSRYRPVPQERECECDQMGREQFHWGLCQKQNGSDTARQRSPAWLHGAARSRQGHDGDCPGNFAADTQSFSQRSPDLQDFAEPRNRQARQTSPGNCPRSASADTQSGKVHGGKSGELEEEERGRQSFDATAPDSRQNGFVTDTDRERWEQAWHCLLEGKPRPDDFRRLIAQGDRPGIPADAHSPGFQGHAGHDLPGGRPESYRPIAPQDLRGRVNGTDWWHEARTGIPVLAHGLSSRMAEAFARCTGNSVVPQTVVPFAEAIYKALVEMTKAG